MKKTCLKCLREFQKPYNCSKRDWLITKYCSHSCANSINSLGTKRCVGRIPWNKGKKQWQTTGKNNPNWKGGTYGTERHKAMGQIEYILWRTAVFMRDDYTCLMCNVKGGKLNADHIKPWSLYPELRYAIDNGRTLCVSCHMTTDTWGYRVKHLSLAPQEA